MPFVILFNKMIQVKEIVRRAIGRGELRFENFVTVVEAAQLLGIARTTVYWRIATGKLPAKRFGKQLLIAKADL